MFINVDFDLICEIMLGQVCTCVKKDKVKRKKKMTIIKEKIENTAKGKCRFRREE